MKPGQITLVETQYGYHIVQVEEVKPHHTDSLEEAKPKIVAAIKEKQGADMARQDVEQDLAAALEGRDLKQLAHKRGLTATETPYVSRVEADKVADSDAKFLDEAFKLAKGDVRAITDTSVPFLAKLQDRVPSQIPPFEQIKDKVRATYVRQHAELLAADAAQALLKQIKAGADFNAIAANNHLQVQTTGFFPRASRQIPGIGPFAEATEAAAAVAKLPSTLDRVLENQGTSFIFRVISRQLPDEQQWKAEGPAFTEQLLQQRRASGWVNFVNDLKRRTSIVVNTQMVGETPEPM
jgi:peptidyl-prolyl cis-trans isomerase D